ncbi:flagellar biosynthesis protein [Novosphingobium sp. FSY-8]|uniref:Flagellar assembly protein FliH n=1 Tax=Novosphingobium ovatum TaxID=1908523 RepID=A0ABW9XG82_9SPHN|nr:FliH/SctL family protein [Novosphingobium ovatum]NBC37511.1 flagellar biosynthesis protein [Novosphingobium ovatum]
MSDLATDSGRPARRGAVPRASNDLSALTDRPAAGFARDTRFVPLFGPPPDDAHIPFAALTMGQTAPAAAPTAAQPEPQTQPDIAPAPDPLTQAHEEGYAQGFSDATLASHQQAMEDDALRDKLRLSFARIDAEMAEMLRQRLLDTVVALCEATLAPLALDRDALAARVERAVAMFARADDETVIRLHPDDLALVQALLPPDWTYVPDPALGRGAIRVEAGSRGQEGGGVEDGPAQWRRAIAEALDIGGIE